MEITNSQPSPFPVGDFNDYVTHTKSTWELGVKQCSRRVSAKLAGIPFSMAPVVYTPSSNHALQSAIDMSQVCRVCSVSSVAHQLFLHKFTHKIWFTP